jgi:hypothetical protein
MGMQNCELKQLSPIPSFQHSILIAWVLQPGKVCDLQFIAVTPVAVLILALGPQAPPEVRITQ